MKRLDRSRKRKKRSENPKWKKFQKFLKEMCKDIDEGIGFIGQVYFEGGYVETYVVSRDDDMFKELNYRARAFVSRDELKYVV